MLQFFCVVVVEISSQKAVGVDFAKTSKNSSGERRCRAVIAAPIASFSPTRILVLP
jgi:hypothetical protein